MDQITRAVGEMNQVTQQVAANAQESAAASEELNAQAMQMRDFVQELMVLVEGARNTHLEAEGNLLLARS